MDPGIRILFTGYNCTEEIIKFETNISESLHIVIKKELNKKNRKISRVWNKFSINDCHRKIAKFLCESYDTILLPVFEIQDIADSQ